MTLWYLIGAVVVLGIAILSMIGVRRRRDFTPLVWVGRFLPAVAALIACIAYCMAATRARLGFLAPVFFCLPLAALMRADAVAAFHVGPQFQRLHDAAHDLSGADPVSGDGALASGHRLETADEVGTTR